MAESQTRGLGCVLIAALFAFSAVVTAGVIFVNGLWQGGNRPADGTVGEPLKQETGAGSEGQVQISPAPRLVQAPRKSTSISHSPRVLKGHGAIVAVVAVSADGAQLLSADINDLICTWDRIAGTRLTTIESTGLGLRRAVFSPNSRYILACDNENGVRMWKASSGQAVRTFRGHSDLVSALHFVPGTDQFLSSSFDATLILWDMQTEKPIRQFGKVLNAKDGAQPAPSASEELNRPSTGHATGHSTWIRAVVALPDGKRVVSAGNDGVVFLWDLETGTLVYRFEGHQGAIIGLTLAPDGRWLASLGADKEIIVWDVEQRKLLRRSKHPSHEFPAMEVSPDSRLLALGDDAGVIRLMDLESGAERSKIETGGIGVASLAFTPELEGAEIVAGCTDGTIRIWPLPLER